MNRIDIAGLMVCSLSMEEAAARVATLAGGEKKGCVVVTPNAEIAYDAMADSSFLQMLNKAELILPDGAGIVLASKILGTPVKQKVAGVELAHALLPEFERLEIPLFLFGGKPGVAEAAAANMKKEFPKLNVCGVMDGYFDSDEKALKKIEASGAAVVFCCLGAPKQEHFMFRVRERVPARVLIGLGGTLDVFAGTVKRAPRIFIKLNLEWLYRLIKQPSRYKRMLKLPKYIIKVIGLRLKKREDNK